MLAIRMQRTGRRGHTQFRVIVQDSHFHPTRGRVVAYLGSYNPHTKTAQIDTEVASKYLKNGAQPSDRVARLLKSEGVKLPDWVKLSDPKKREIRNPEKLRRNRPAGAEAPAPAPEAPAETASETPAETPSAEETPAAEPAAAETVESPAETPTEPTTEEQPAETAEAPAPSEAPAEAANPEEPTDVAA